MRAVDWLPGLGLRPRNRSRRRGRRDVHLPPAGAWLLEERRLMARLHAAAPLPMPSNTVASLSDVLYTNSNVPTKQITITNNTTNRTIYPFIEAENSTQDLVPGSPYYGQSLYDPLDPYNQEYRGYIGYVGANGQNYLGLRAGQKVTVNLPLALWNGGRIEIANTAENFTPNATDGAAPTTPNPFQYYAFNAPAPDGTPRPTARFAIPTAGAGSKALVMWYHGIVPHGPRDDAPAQLTEHTFRDPYLGTLPNAQDIPDSEKITLINYDVSYVDSIALPVATEAADVALYPTRPNSPHKAFGWVGSTQTYPQMEAALAAFASNVAATNRLGLYFGGKQGYAKYYNPDPTNAGVKLPSGQDAIADSPLNNVLSSYDNNRFALTGAGTAPIAVINGAYPNGTTALKLVPPPASDPNRFANLQVGMTVTCSTPNIVQPNTTITKINQTGGKVTSVTLSSPAADGKGASFVFTFTRPIVDVVTSTITNLWYGWAQYYVARNQNVPTVSGVAGTTTAGSNVLTLNAPVSGLVPGMLVTTGGGVLPAVTTVLSVDAGGTSVTLSRVASAGGAGSFTFSPPQPILGTDQVSPLTLSFTTAAAQAQADQFAQVVYRYMSALSTATEGVGNTPLRLMHNAIGNNIGFIPGLNDSLAGVYTKDAKSLLRGVYDYQQVPASTGQWYPNPATKTAGATVNGAPAGFNLYNLDPFVWFVHQWLGLSGYGFALDDDVSDVGAPGASQLLVSVGGPGGLANPVEWKPALPFGPVQSTTGQIAKGSTALTGLDPDVVAQLVSADPNIGLVGATVTGPGIAPGTTVLTTVIGGTQVNLSKPASSPGQASASQPYMFSLSGSSSSAPHRSRARLLAHRA